MPKLISLTRLSEFWDKVKEYIQNKFNILDKKIDKQIFQGTQAELEAAIAAGLVDENTLIILTDGEEETIYEICTLDDIKALFPEYA